MKESPMNFEEMERTVFAPMRLKRTHAILRTVAEEKCDFMTAVMIYDEEKAPLTTDREKFKMIGFEFPADFVPASDEDATLFNERVMAAYAMWGDQVAGYDHLTPCRLSAVLQGVMNDAVRLIPPVVECKQYIDLSFAKE